MVYTQFWCLVLVIFSVSLKRKKYTCNSFSSILCSHKCGLFIHAFMHPTMAFMWWGKTGMLNIFCNSYGRLIWVRTIPVKIDQILTGMIRNSVNINATETLGFLKPYEKSVFFENNMGFLEKILFCI